MQASGSGPGAPAARGGIAPFDAHDHTRLWLNSKLSGDWSAQLAAGGLTEERLTALVRMFGTLDSMVKVRARDGRPRPYRTMHPRPFVAVHRQVDGTWALPRPGMQAHVCRLTSGRPASPLQPPPPHLHPQAWLLLSTPRHTAYSTSEPLCPTPVVRPAGPAAAGGAVRSALRPQPRAAAAAGAGAPGGRQEEGEGRRGY